MLRQRILSAVIAAVLLFVVLFALPETVARLVIVAVVLTAAWEWAGLLSLAGPVARGGYTVLVAGLIGLVFVALTTPWALEGVLLAALAWWLAALVWLRSYPTPVPVAVAWFVGILVLVPAWVALDFLYRVQPALLLFMLVIVWAADIGAYFAGKQFGRVKLAPMISPGKTWEGVIGGLLLVLVLVLLRGYWVGDNLAVLVPFCVAVALSSVVGDLTVSIFKRNAGVKDSGSLFPGHGGLLDRIDSVTAAAPLFALGVIWFGVR